MADTKLYKVAITPCGKYVHGTEYDRLCLVLNATEDGGDGCSYVSLQKNKNVKPGTDDTVWALSLERGEQGEQGPSGAGFSQVSISVDGTSGTPSGTAVIENDTLYLSFSGMKGAPGEIDEEQIQGIEDQISAKQDALVSGTNIKTINNESILGSGNINVEGGQDGEDGVGFDSITTPVTPDGTAQITLTNGDTITLDLNHNHPQYPKYMLLEHELEYEDITVKDPETLYLIISDETAPQDGGSSV